MSLWHSLSDFLDPISLFQISEDQGYKDGQLGTKVMAHEEEFPDVDEADIVIVGVSRTGKTPLSMYLGYLGYKTANTPLVPGVEPPAQLFRVDRSKIVGLTIDPERLQRIRGRRLRAMGGRARDSYADLAKILEEIDDCTSVFRKLGCPVIDVSNLAVEESALRVINLVEERSRAEGDTDGLS